MIRALAILALCSCNDVFQQPYVDPPAPDAAREAETVTVTTSHIYVANDVGGLPTVTTIAEPLATAVVLEDGTHPLLVQTATGATFERPAGMPYQLSVEREPVPLEYELATPQLAHARRDIRRLDSALPGDATIAKVTMSGAPGLGVASLYSTGVWAFAQRSDGTSNGSYSITWPNATSLGGTLGLPDATKNDELWCTVRMGLNEGFNTQNYEAVTHASRAVSATLVSGATTPVSCASASVSRDACALTNVMFAPKLARLGELTSSAYYSAGTWSTLVMAQPIGGLINGLPLAGAAGNNPQFPGGAYRMHYANPFPGHITSVRWLIYRTRTIENGATPITLNVAMAAVQAAPLDCSTTLPDITAAVTTVPALDNVQIVMDSSVTLDRSKNLELTWQVRQGDVVDYFLAHLEHITPDGLVDVATWAVLDPHVSVDPALFVTGERYVIRLDANSGYPHAREGDFVTSAWPEPVTASTQFSGVVTIAN